MWTKGEITTVDDATEFLENELDIWVDKLGEDMYQLDASETVTEEELIAEAERCRTEE